MLFSLSVRLKHFNPYFCRKFSDLGFSGLSSSSYLINVQIRASVQQGRYSEALQLYTENLCSPLHITKFTFPSLIKACGSLSDPYHGKTIHSTIVTMGLQSDTYIATSLINMYVRCGSLSSAIQVFVKISDSGDPARDVGLWNSIIDGYFRYGRLMDGLSQFCQMQSFGVKPDPYSLSILLGIFEIVQGKEIHAYILRKMFNQDPFLETALINMYSKCGRPMKAKQVFDKLEDKNNVVAWNAMISGFCDNGMWEKSLEFFAFMKNVNCKLGPATFSSVLVACSCGEDAYFGKEVHCDVIKMGYERDPYVSNSLLTMYAKCRLLGDAQEFFYLIRDKEIELWNAMISAYISNDCPFEALDIYSQIKLREALSDPFTIINTLSACSMVGLYDFGRTLHGELIKRPVQLNVGVQSALLTMYSKCGSVEDAYAVFCDISERDVVAWGSMISGFFQSKMFNEALALFQEMQIKGVRIDPTIMTCVIGSCMGLDDVESGCAVHGFVIKSGTELDVYVGSALVDMYSKCGLPEVAESVFSTMPSKNLVAWNSIISGYCRNGLPEVSISIFPQIVQCGLTPDSVSLTSLLVAISSIVALLKGKTVHGYQIKLGIQLDTQVENALIDMYIKCGCLKAAECIFESRIQRDIVAWNSMIAGYGSHGECLKSIGLFDKMQQAGVKPDEVTFLALLSSCSHSGLIQEGLRLFKLMKEEYNIEPGIDHYVNMVDLWGRAGHLDEAYNFIQRMAIKPDRSIWLCLLCACRIHRNLELGALAANNLLQMEPAKSSNYVQLLNLYGEAKLWDKAANIRASMKEKGLKKSPGCSWIEVKNKFEIFYSRDSSSSRTVEIYETLTTLGRNIEGADWHSGVPL